MVVKRLRTRLKGLEASNSFLSHRSPLPDPNFPHQLTACLVLVSSDMLCLPLTALFGVVRCNGARCCYRTGDAEAAC